MIALIREEGLPDPESEYKFHPTRKWRFDLAWPDHHIAVEIEGGLYGGRKSKKDGSPTQCPECGRWPPGAHSSITGIRRDIEKYNAAQALGWQLYRVIPTELTKVIPLLKKAMRPGKPLVIPGEFIPPPS